ncbi:MAG: DUF1707 domain-containing protein [Propionibacteriales bacterium]|nr:DUF1707 domain-containing protein [Propionibacteriales bacterium]
MTTGMRAGDADRERAAETLRNAHAEGRLDLAEFEERLDAAFAAKYVEELPPLLADLPSQQPAARRVERAPERWRGPSPLLRVVLVTCVVFAVVGSIAAVSRGFFPFPLLWVALIAFFVLRGRRFHSYGRHFHPSYGRRYPTNGRR